MGKANECSDYERYGEFGITAGDPLVRCGNNAAVFDIRSQPHLESPESREVDVIVGILAIAMPF